MIILNIVEIKNFHSFEERCVQDIKFINMENNEEIVLTIIMG